MGKRLIGSVGLAETAHTGFDLTTKGDMHGFSTTQARIPVGTNNYSVLADSSQALGLKWGVSATSVLSATGDILYASGANTLARLSIGSDDQVLTLASGVPSWADAGGAGETGTANNLDTSGTFSTDSTSLVDVTGMDITLPDIAGSDNCLIMYSGNSSISDISSVVHYAIIDDTTSIVAQDIEMGTLGRGMNFGMQTITDASGNTAKLQMSAGAGSTGYLKANATKNSILTAFAS